MQRFSWIKKRYRKDPFYFGHSGKEWADSIQHNFKFIKNGLKFLLNNSSIEGFSGKRVWRVGDALYPCEKFMLFIGIPSFQSTECHFNYSAFCFARKLSGLSFERIINPCYNYILIIPTKKLNFKSFIKE